MESKQKFITTIVFDKYKEHASSAIKHIKALPYSCRQSGDDLYLTDVWEEFKFQLQNEHTLFFDAYELTIRQICLSVAELLPENEKRLLWLWSDEYVEWDEEDDCNPPYNSDGVADQIYKTVCEIGIDEPLLRDADPQGDDDGHSAEDDHEVQIPIEIGVELTLGWSGERWDIVDVVDQRNGQSIGDIGVSQFDAYSNFPGHLLLAVVRTLRGEETFLEGVFYSVSVDIVDGGTSIGKATAHFWNDGLPAWE